MRLREFERLVMRAIEEIPEVFRDRLDGVALIVEEWPPDELLAEMSMGEDELLFGYYDGIPLNEPDRYDLTNMHQPDRIYIFKGPIEEVCSSRQEIIQEIRKTVMHEIGHYFGLSEEEVEHL